MCGTVMQNASGMRHMHGPLSLQADKKVAGSGHHLSCHFHSLCCWLLAAEVGRFLLSRDVAAIDSNLNSDLSPSTVSSWLTAASKCGLEQHAQLCIDYIVIKCLPVDMELLTSLTAAHANQLLIYMQSKSSQAISRLDYANSKMAKLEAHLGTGRWYSYDCSCCAIQWIANVPQRQCQLPGHAML